VLAAFIAQLPYDPLEIHGGDVLQPPSPRFWFGTDSLGRDIFSRTIAGARLDLPLALLGVSVSIAIGVCLGLLASTKTSAADLLMRGLDMFQAFPLFVLAIAVVVLTGNHIGNVPFAIALFSVPVFIRIVRGEALALRESRFVEAATAIGASRIRILLRHLLPNMTGPILVQASLNAAGAILTIGGLAYLGFGIRPPVASWGSMLQAGSGGVLLGQWWPAIFPGLAIVVCVMCLNVIAENLEVILGRGARG